MKTQTLARFVPLAIALATLGAVCAATSAAVNFSPGTPEAEGVDSRAVSSVFSPQVRAWDPQIRRWAGAVGLDPNLVATVMQIESCGNPRAVSRSGAQGLFQVMPFHFSAGEDMQNPEINARRGLTYLAESLLKSEGDIRRALAGYNGGHGVIGWAETQWPSETKRYAYWGEGVYADAAADRAVSPRLEEWLAAGGFSLCEEVSA